ncbi:peptide ABC transporter ATP-binding protein [Williamsia sp. Leaf354]|jgi:peptide/nickel transport system ATP-binding protein|uniref:ABC transporter ATP-binding protein n=1 Tax=Williamsia sp. Leaf354 TaxID=1736349 RepID=UPI0006FB5872|nr:ABC transporter ATP-binding protein [Williamsia sp. Leaf354]KQR96300.1 peptide ABC transporter ATP-binding protein [Williamsia sp. Leaf354]
MTAGDPILSLTDLRVSFPTESGVLDAVRGLDLTISAGRCTAIVGESGSGKSVTSLAVMGLLPDTAEVTGSIRFAGTELAGLDDRAMSTIRGSEMSMIFQDPLTALTPVYTIGDQIVEALRAHSSTPKAQARIRAAELLELVGIPDPARRMTSFPHELSGGMRQRVVIAIAIANDPKLIIADEPTTALDVTIQAQVIDLLTTIRRETGAALLLITHDLGLVAGTADDVAVMYAGRVVERASATDLYAGPRMPYTAGLLASIPRIDRDQAGPLVPIPGQPPVLIDVADACPFAPRCPAVETACTTTEPALVEIGTDHLAACHRSAEISGAGLIDGSAIFAADTPGEKISDAGVSDAARDVVLSVRGLTREFPILTGLLRRRIGSVYAVDGLDFDVHRGETMAIVGESGSGKTTTLLEILRAEPGTTGTVEIGGTDFSTLSRRALRTARKAVQIVFQDPMGSLNPRMTVRDIIAEPLRAYRDTTSDLDARVSELMRLVGLDPAHAARFPAAFSGGQRQRIGIARALAVNPTLVVLDEPVSALDVSIQASIINLLDRLKREIGVAYLFVAHDLSVVRHLSDRVAVMYLGKFVEIGTVADIFDRPTHPYTRALLSAIPIPDPALERTRERVVLTGELPSPSARPGGCSFHNRCPLRPTLPERDQKTCISEVPVLRSVDAGSAHQHACHFADTVVPVRS